MFIVKTEIAYRTMKRIFNYIFVSALAFAASSCLNDNLTPDGPSGKTGDEVKFGVSLDTPETKTVYGEETSISGKNVFPIYWTEGDMVEIFSPECLDGKKAAEYKVVLPTGVATPNYAEDLVSTGENGIQWGSASTASFYSLYPASSYTLSDDGKKAENVVIEYMQNIVVEKDENGNDIIKSDMESCLLYAKATDVAKGNTVNLHYNPISTVVMLTLKVAANTDAIADNFTIQSVSLVAPEGTNIAGTFNLNISDGTFAGFASDNASETVMAQIVNPSTNGLHTMSNGDEFTVPLFIAPDSYKSVNGWKVQVVANGNVYTKSLSSINATLAPGKIHKITLPELKPATTEWEVSKWMTYIPRNVYLSEISIPGSWNSINPDFQTTGTTDKATIESQYNKGVRAFHLDTRWKAEYSWTMFSHVVGLGVADGGNNGNASSSLITSGDKYMTGDGTPLVKDIIDQLVGYIKTTPQEYMVLVCTFAQESINYQSSNGYWYDEISAICNDSNYADYIVDGSKVNANTVVGDVLGKILVIVNMQGAITSDTTLPSNSKCIFTYMPSELSSARFASLENAETVIANNSDNLWYSASATTATGIKMYNNQAQITSSTGTGITHNRGYAPSVSERSSVLNTILDWSRNNYGTDNYKHNAWIYLGLGGYQVSSGGNAGSVSGSYSTIAETYNTWINGRVTEMGTVPPGATTAVPYYPVGIVLMNYVANYETTVKNILLLNNKYRLQFDPEKPTDYNPNAKAASDYDASAPTGGSAF